MFFHPSTPMLPYNSLKFSRFCSFFFLVTRSTSTSERPIMVGTRRRPPPKPSHALPPFQNRPTEPSQPLAPPTVPSRQAVIAREGTPLHPLLLATSSPTCSDPRTAGLLPSARTDSWSKVLFSPSPSSAAASPATYPGKAKYEHDSYSQAEENEEHQEHIQSVLDFQASPEQINRVVGPSIAKS